MRLTFPIYRHAALDDSGAGGGGGDAGKKAADDAAAAATAAGAGAGGGGDAAAKAAADKAAADAAAAAAAGGDGAAKAAADAAAAAAAKGGDPLEWRGKLTTGLDPKDAKLFDRYTDLPSIGKALVAANKRIAEGFKAEPFPEKGTDAEKTAWREKQGVPASADAYIANVKQGIVVGEEDKDIFGDFAKLAQERNLPQGAFDVAAEWYMNWRAEQQATLSTLNEQAVQTIEDTLVTELGPGEFRANRANMEQMLDTYFTPKAADAIRHAIMVGEDGTLGVGLVNNIEVFKGLMAVARQINPMPSLAGSGNDPGMAAQTRLEELQGMRKKDYDGYMKNEKLVKEERDLITAIAQMKGNRG